MSDLSLSLSVHSFDFDKKQITVEARLPSLNITGNYEVSGKLVSLPISGKGAMKSIFRKCSFRFKYKPTRIKFNPNT
jgi:hypothetical protein